MAQQHRPVTFGRDGDPACPQARQHVARLVPGALDPGGRVPRRGVGPRLVPVTAAHRDRRGVPGQPPGQRSGPAQVEPARMPDLDQRRAAAHRADPAERPGERVVDRQQAARCFGGVQPVVRLPAEVDPADLAERSGVSAVGRHLLAGQQRDPVPPGRRGQFGVVADRVVVGDREEVQAASGRQGGQFGDGQHTVRVHGVRVQVTGQPALPLPGWQGPARRPVPGLRRLGRGRRRPQGRAHRRGLGRQPVAHAVRRDTVHADHHLPRPGLDLPGQVAWRGRLGGDDERLAGAARPAAEPARAKAAEVEHRSVDALVFEFDPQPGRPGRHLHRQVVPGGREAVLERPPPRVPRPVRHASHLTRSGRPGQPLASATTEDLVAIGPTMQRCLTGDIGPAGLSS